MLEHYAIVKAVHIGAVAASGLVFVVRGLMVQAGKTQWALGAPVRYASYAIDTVLLVAALALVAMLPSAVFANHWLSVKLGLIVAYIVLGSFAIKRAATARGRASFFVAAIVAYALVVGVAIAHHPKGWFA